MAVSNRLSQRRTKRLRLRADDTLRFPEKIVFASGNAGKLREIACLLSDFNISLVAQADFGVNEVTETGSTFTENALIKANHAAAAAGLPAIADDSGLVVAALEGRPGVYSARYSGPDATDDSNIDKLLDEMRGLPDASRGATFQCAACFAMPDDPEPLIAEGQWRGQILHERRGDHGFGYDPVFFDPEAGKSAAELSTDEKNARSHRGKALAMLGLLLRARFNGD